MNRALTRLAALRHAFPNTVAAVVRRTAGYSLSSERPAVVSLQQDVFSPRHYYIGSNPAYQETTAEVRVDWPAVTDERFAALASHDWSAATVDETCDGFLSTTVYAAPRGYQLQDTVFAGLRDRLAAVLPDMTDQQLMDALQLIARWDTKNLKDPVYCDFWSRFDKQCIVRYKNWSLNKLLLYMDHWFAMGLIKHSNFVWFSVKKLARKPSRLTPQQLVQMLCYTNISTKFSPYLPMYDIEQELFLYYNDFNIQELSIVALCFFKTNMPIRNQDLVKKLYTSVINEITTITSNELSSFLKIFGYCTKSRNADSMYKLMDVLVDKVAKVNLICCTFMAQLGTKLMVRHEDLLKTVSQRIVKEISQTRLTDLERITFSLSTLNYNPRTIPCIFETVIKELRSDNKDFEMHIKCYFRVLSYLAVMGIFPYDCIAKALQKENLHKCFGKKLSRFNVPRDIVALNNCMLIECPDYPGPFLPDILNISCNEHLAWHIPSTDSSPKLTFTSKNFLKLYEGLLRLFKTDAYLHICYPLPHHPKSDILFCIGADGRPVAIPETMTSRKVFNDFEKPPELGKWFAIVNRTRKSLLHFSQENNGLMICKIRQLKKLNYEPILFNIYEFGKECDIQQIISERLRGHQINL